MASGKRQLPGNSPSPGDSPTPGACDFRVHSRPSLRSFALSGLRDSAAPFLFDPFKPVAPHLPLRALRLCVRFSPQLPPPVGSWFFGSSVLWFFGSSSRAQAPAWARTTPRLPPRYSISCSSPCLCASVRDSSLRPSFHFPNHHIINQERLPAHHEPVARLLHR
jgi:hypothetical protein